MGTFILSNKMLRIIASIPFWKGTLLAIHLFWMPQSSNAESFPILPEVQVYHTLGTGGSNYSSGALGVAVHLFDEEGGPGRYMHFLSILVPSKTLGFDARIGNLKTASEGQGFEIGVHDQWVNPAGKGATLSLRRIDWKKMTEDSEENEKARSDLLHMGWSWSMDRQGFVVWLFGIDIANLKLPSKSIIELQLALGLRSAF